MDSVTEENLIYFQNRCVQIVNTPDQDETDFTKALKELKRHVDETNLEVQYYNFKLKFLHLSHVF